MEKELEFINNRIEKKAPPIPSLLYKYRPFDGYVFDMLENRYVYLCPAENLDDPSECKVDFTVDDLYDLQTNCLTVKGVDMILEFVNPHTSEENFQRLKSIVYRTMNQNGEVARNLLLESVFEMQELIPDEDIAPIINQLGNIPERINEPQIRDNFEKLFALAYKARKDMGICSLSELRSDGVMWKEYAGYSTGYCIEYDMSGYEHSDLLFPVVYQDNRESNIVTNILGSFIGQMIFGISNGQINTDKSQFIRLFLTKDNKWSHQKEWRLIGDAKMQLTAPKISKIYLGEKMLAANREQLIDYCKKSGIMYE